MMWVYQWVMVLSDLNRRLMGHNCWKEEEFGAIEIML